jgi:CCR4-NOT transcription complex subunit 6
MNRLTRDNVALVAVLEVLMPGSARQGRLNRLGPLQLAVANTHLYSNKEYPDVKLWQCLSFVRELEQLVLSRDLPLVICGDFNSVPSSAVYGLLAHHGVPEGHPDLADDAACVLPMAAEITHGLSLVSAYAAVQGEEPPYTNYTDGFKGVLDYVWCSAAHLRPLGVMAVPPDEALQRSGVALPNAQVMRGRGCEPGPRSCQKGVERSRSPTGPLFK